MATSARHSGMVGYNVQIAVDTETHLIVAHEVTNQGFDREQLSPMATAAKEAELGYGRNLTSSRYFMPNFVIAIEPTLQLPPLIFNSKVCSWLRPTMVFLKISASSSQGTVVVRPMPHSD
jgi:hypothetical protein